MPKYSFGWNEKAAVECPELDAFINDLVSLFERHGIGYEMENPSEGYGYLVPVPFARADFTMFPGHLEEYRGGIPWLDKAKQRYEATREIIEQENRRKNAIKQESDERAQFERLKEKYGAQS